MKFEVLLDAILGPREMFYHMECHVCGSVEIYYQDPETKKQIGFACRGCNWVISINSNINKQ